MYFATNFSYYPINSKILLSLLLTLIHWSFIYKYILFFSNTTNSELTKMEEHKHLLRVETGSCLHPWPFAITTLVSTIVLVRKTMVKNERFSYIEHYELKMSRPKFF